MTEITTNKPEEVQRWLDRGYIVSQGVLYRYNPDSEAETAQIVVATQERAQILDEYHDQDMAGHGGIERTYLRISQRYYWPGMRRQITTHVKNCTACQKYKSYKLRPEGLIQTPTMSHRFEVLAFDLFGPLPTSKDGWLFVIEDTASKWVELFPLQDATALRCAETLLNEVFLRYGLPRRIISDNGAQFTSAIVQKLTYCLGIKHNFTPVYHPAANPVERKNRDLKTQLAILVGNQHASWPDKIPAIRFAMNSGYTASTRFSPAYLTFGRELRTPDDINQDLRSIVQKENFVAEITPRLLQLADTLKTVKENCDFQTDQQKTQADKKRLPTSIHQPGDLVLIKLHQLSNKEKQVTSKFLPKRDGPYVIMEQQGPTSYRIATQEDPKTPLDVYHASQKNKFQWTRR